MSQRNQTHSTIPEINPDLYPNMYTAVITVMSVLTAMADRPYSAMQRLNNYLRSTMTTERMSGQALIHVHKNIELDAERKSVQSSEKRAHCSII